MNFSNLSNTAFIDRKYRYSIYFVVLLVMVYLLLLIFAKRIETSVSFPAVHYNVQELSGYISKNITFEEINVTSEDGDTINGLYAEGRIPNKIVYYFHGNGGSLEYFYSEIAYILSLGYTVIAFDYPGYGKSSGYPYEQKVYTYARDFFAYLQDQKGIREEDTVIWGYSIGTAIAVDFAVQHPVERLILVAPLSSRYDMSRAMVGFPIQKYLGMANSLDSLEKIKNISIPTLIIHGNSDNIVPFEQGKKLFSASPSKNKYFIELDGWGHNYILSSFANELKGVFINFISSGVLGERYVYLDDSEKKHLLQLSLRASFDFDSDDSLTKYVDPQIHFNNLQYVPKNLEYIGSEYVHDTKRNLQLRRDANEMFQRMTEDFYDTFKEKIDVVSAYRSYIYQKGIKDRGCSDDLCAKAGYSEHQTGLAVDLWEASTDQEFLSQPKLQRYYDWLDTRAYLYGFTNTYQKGKEVDGYEIEPWHWRYVGIQLATELHESDQTFAEYYYAQKK